jgi:hypothetical protein
MISLLRVITGSVTPRATLQSSSPHKPSRTPRAPKFPQLTSTLRSPEECAQCASFVKFVILLYNLAILPKPSLRHRTH